MRLIRRVLPTDVAQRLRDHGTVSEIREAAFAMTIDDGGPTVHALEHRALRFTCDHRGRTYRHRYPQIVVSHVTIV